MIANFSGDSAKPGAIARIIKGAAIIPHKATAKRIIARNLTADLAMLKASSSPLFARYSENTGTKAMLREPSPKSLLSRLGILKAAMNASA